MIKILVPTDLSANSKAGLRFAIQMASQSNAELIFIHFYYLERNPSVAEEYLVNFERTEAKSSQADLEKFVGSVYDGMKITLSTYKCVAKRSDTAEKQLVEYAAAQKINYICMGTRGAGTLKKIFGSTTSYLIHNSSVPIIVVPSKYHVHKISTVLYASDLKNLDNELKSVSAFAKPLNAKVELLHFNHVADYLPVEKIDIERDMALANHNVIFHVKKIDLTDTLVSSIRKVVKQSKPSVLVMFIEQNRSFFEKIFLSSKTNEYALSTHSPILVINKT